MSVSSSLTICLVIFCLFYKQETFAFSPLHALSIRSSSNRNSITTTIPLNAGTNKFNRNIPNNKGPPPPINDNIFINAREVRVLLPDEDGKEELLGVMTLDEAKERAAEEGVDLVLINKNADPPVCKIIDYGKFRYEIEKKKKENAKKQVVGGMKEVKMSYKIDHNDFDVRQKRAIKFIQSGDRVKCVVQFKGREMQHSEIGKDLLLRLFEPLNEFAVMDGTPKLEGRSMIVIISPKKVNK